MNLGHILFNGPRQTIFIGPESDHWLMAMLVNNSLTHCRLANLIDVSLACEDANSILVEVVTVDAEKHVRNSLVQIWKLKF